MANPVSVLLVDDHQIFKDGLKGILSGVPGLEVLGEASDGWEAWNWLRDNQVDIVVTDIQMKQMDGIALTQRIKLHRPDQKVLVLSMYDDVSVVNQIFDAEADGYVLKNAGRKEFLTAIERVAEGSSYYSREIMKVLMSDRQPGISGPPPHMLSPRELEVLGLICEEFSTKEIAEKLFLSPRTVDSHRKNILEKTGVTTLVGLVKFAFRHGIANL